MLRRVLVGSRDLRTEGRVGWVGNGGASAWRGTPCTSKALWATYLSESSATWLCSLLALGVPEVTHLCDPGPPGTREKGGGSGEGTSLPQL